MEIPNCAEKRTPRKEGSRIIYPIMRPIPANSESYSWSSTSDLAADPLDSSSTVFLVHGKYEDLTSGEDSQESFALMHAIFADWRFLEAYPSIDPVKWIEQRTTRYAGKKRSGEIITRLQALGWLAPRKEGIEITARFNVVRDHRAGRPQNEAYCIAFGTTPVHYLTVNLHPHAGRI